MSITKPRHTTGRSGTGARPGDGAGLPGLGANRNVRPGAKGSAYSPKHCEKLCRIQNPDTPRAGRVGAAHGGAAGRGGAGQDGTPLGRSGPESTFPLALQQIEKTVLNVISDTQTV